MGNYLIVCTVNLGEISISGINGHAWYLRLEISVDEYFIH